MKYLIKYPKETVLTAVMIIVIAYVLYDGIRRGAAVQSIVESLTYIVVWYYNMPTSFEGEVTKRDMLQMKELRNEVSHGDEPDDSEVD